MLRKDDVGREHFHAPTVLPVLGALTCAFLAGPWARSEEQQGQYPIAGGLLALGIVLWVLTWIVNRAVFGKRTFLRDPEEIENPDHVRH